MKGQKGTTGEPSVREEIPQQGANNNSGTGFRVFFSRVLGLGVLGTSAHSSALDPKPKPKREKPHCQRFALKPQDAHPKTPNCKALQNPLTDPFMLPLQEPPHRSL